MKITKLLSTTALVCASFAATMPAIAQTPPATPQDLTTEPDDPETLGQNEVELESGQAAADDVSGDEIVVTGSRIRRPNLDSVVPITSVGTQELVERGDLSLGDALSQLPALRSTFTQANSTGSIGTAGLNILDLRGLGTARTLVLVNGRRHVTAQPGSLTVDVNTIPTDLLERVDLVTGGNSAIYGSDAVAGVVNFVLKRDFEGVKLRGQAGVSTYGDRGSYFLSGVFGKNFFDNRLNIAVAAEYAKSEPLFYSEREYLGSRTGVPGFITSQITTAPNRNFDGIPNVVFVDGNPGITFGNLSTGGYLSTVCPAANATNAARRAAVCTGRTTPTGGLIPYNFAFAPDGTLLRDDESQGLVDNRNIGGGVLGGLSATGVEDAMLLPGLDRYAVNVLMSADLSDAFKPFLEAKYVHVDSLQQSVQPSFISGNPLPNTFSINNPFLTQQARDTINLITGGAATFNILRFNNDFGTRAENHDRDTYRLVVGVGGDVTPNLRYEVAFNYGRTDTFYETGGNLLLSSFRNAINAVRNPAGQIVCGINADAIATNDDAACVPLNVFGLNAPSQAALDYVSFVSSREQRAEQLNVTGFVSGDSTGLFELPGGPIGFAIGGEYREESAYSAYDPVTQVSPALTFLNSFAVFDPPKQKVKEAFAELRVPLLRETPFFHELTLEGSGRVSDYADTGAVWAYNVGATWAPVRDLRIRASYAKSVRAPNLTNLFASRTETFNTITDPCDQPGGTNSTNNVNSGPNRASNCAAAGVPTSITYTQSDGTVVTRPYTNIPGATISGFNQGNPGLVPEVGKSFTVGAVFQPRFLPGFSLSLDYYNIKIEDVISGLTGQQIVNRCYDDAAGIENPFCDAVFRRSSADPIANGTFDGQSSRRLEGRTEDAIPRLGPGFINQPFNFAALKTSGIDLDAAYRTRVRGEVMLNLRGIVSWVENRESFSFISEPDRSDRFHGTLGDPVWAGSLNANLDFGAFEFTYSARYVGKQIVSGLGYETFFPRQGRPATNPDARPFVYYDPVVYHGIRFGADANERFRFYAGVDNVSNELPPFELTGTGADAIYPNTGRFFYAGAEVNF